jgi:hypothetical protein
MRGHPKEALLVGRLFLFNGWPESVHGCGQETVVVVNLYLDVDGVLLPEANRMDSDVDDWVTTKIFKNITWSPSIVAAVAKLPVSIVWLSTWGKEANTYLCPEFGWEPKEALGQVAEGLWWKLESVLDHQDPDEPFVWIDDEILWRLGESEGEYGELLSGLRAPRMLVAPWSGQGLTMAQIDEVAAFVDRVSVRTV